MAWVLIHCESKLDWTRYPVNAVPIVDAGRFAHEAVAVLDGILYETEDRGDAAFYRFVSDRKPREWGDLATFGRLLNAMKQQNFTVDLLNLGNAIYDSNTFKTLSPDSVKNLYVDQVYGMFLDIGYDAFHLTRVADVRLPGGRPLFPEIGPDRTPEQVLASRGLKPGPTQELDPAAKATLVTWRR